MKNIKWIFVLFAVLAALSIMGFGIAISAKSLVIAILSLIILIAVMGLGFTTKKKYREEGKL
ncbi:YlaF family protein [Bacillus seohaeanensis]|jgi:hypothetical protein|uniref:YlaF family protein n=1 Tax=Bacillus seohaeanensis TaxID=284580 RepID=A0ABW5RMH4_9BACI